MLHVLHVVLSSPAGHGAVTGLITAAAVDLHAFASWRKWQDLSQYDWGTAAFRWFSGIVLGAFTGAGINVVGM